MSILTNSTPDVSPLAIAGLLLCARAHSQRLGLSHPSVSEVLQATSASRSRAFEIRRTTEEILPRLTRSRGRPPREKTTSPIDDADLSQKILAFVMDHPGCVSGGGERRHYADIFRCRVLELREDYPSLDLQTFAKAVCVPVGTLEDWLRPGRKLQEPPEACAEVSSLDEGDMARAAKLQVVLDEYPRWKGPFAAFCDHVRFNHRVRLSNTMIGDILSTHGMRKPRSRPGRSPDEEALRHSFETFFPGAQWVGDGKTIPVTIDQDRFDFNFELFVDASSDAHVGLSLRDTEDSQAVVDAFQQGVETTGAPPLAALLDNRPSNHTDVVDEALGDTLRTRATRGRPENKAHAEGAFGLFSQTAPPLEITTENPQELARQIALLVLTTYCRTINGRPRRDREGKSRIDLYDHPVTEEERDQAREALRERQQKQEQARRTREARLDPIRAKILDQAFDRLELLDPERYIRNAIARYPLNDIVDGIAIYSGKKERGTLPKDVDARYLLGIVRNVHHVHDSEVITEALLKDRLNAHDQLLNALKAERDDLLSQEPDVAVRLLVDKALENDRTLDRIFWLSTAAELIRRQPDGDKDCLARSAAGRIHATFRLPPKDRNAAERFVFRRVWPLS